MAGRQESVAAAAEAVQMAAAHQLRHNLSAVRDVTDELVQGALGHEPRLVDAAAAKVLRSHLAQLWLHGWLPIDVYQMARRNRSDLAALLAVDMIAADTAQYSAAAVHPRWHDQLAELGAAPWWDSSRPHASQWAERHQLGRRATITIVIELAALFMSMGKLPVIVPPPGQPTAGTSGQQRGAVDEKILSKVRALLAKAESTSFSEEAEALSAKAQELMARHSIERAMAGPAAPVPAATACRMWLDPPYVGAKSLLVSEVASANRCRTVSYERLGFVTVLGDAADLEAVELLATSLMVQATRAMLAAGRQVTYTGQSRTRSFRHAFLLAYATRIGERLREVTQQHVSAAGKALVPVLAQRERVVDDLFDSLFTAGVARRSFSASNGAGYGAGRAAADQADISLERRSVTR